MTSDGHDPAGGFCVWFTGLSGAGKSATARALETLVQVAGRPVTLLDSDIARARLSAELGFSPADRATNVRRVAFVAGEIVRHGGAVICAAMSPTRDARAEARATIGRERFIEVFVDTALSVCESRDPKGLYRRARSGELVDLTGIHHPYEPPERPEVRLSTVESSIDDNARIVFDLLAARGLVTP